MRSPIADFELDLIDAYSMQSGTCPYCHKRLYTDTGFFECDRCGASESDDYDRGVNTYLYDN